MNKHIAGVVLAIIISIMASVTAGCSDTVHTQNEEELSTSTSVVSSTNEPTNGRVQSHTEGEVTIEVEWLGIQDGLVNFNVSMNTHSVALDGYDLGELSELRDDQGAIYEISSWEGSPGSHHRMGILSFSLPHSLESVSYIELNTRSIGEVPNRIFRWELK